MARLFERAHADWPHTRLTEDGGVHVTGKYWQPGLEAFAGKATGIAAVVFSAYALFGLGNGALALMIGPFMFVVAWFILIRPLVYFLFARKLDLTIYPDRITLPGRFRARNFARALPIEFRIEQHSRALKEKGNARTYREALEVVMQYGENRVSIAGMPQKDIELARALVIRLQNVCQGIDAAVQAATQRAGEQRAPVSDFGAAPDIR